MFHVLLASPTGNKIALYSQPAANSRNVNMSPQNRGPQIFQKSTSHLKILGARKVTWSKCNTEDLERSGANVENLLARATWRPEFVHPCPKLLLFFNYVFHGILLQIIFPCFVSYNGASKGLTNNHEDICGVCSSPIIDHFTSRETATGTHYLGGWGTTRLVWKLWRGKTLFLPGTEPRFFRFGPVAQTRCWLGEYLWQFTIFIFHHPIC
jgi:hypothetical protein